MSTKLRLHQKLKNDKKKSTKERIRDKEIDELLKGTTVDEILDNLGHMRIVSAILSIPNMCNTLKDISSKNLVVFTFPDLENMGKFFIAKKDEEIDIQLGVITNEKLDDIDIFKEYLQAFREKPDEKIGILFECLKMEGNIYMTMDRQLLHEYS
jgi:hypothetical protein